MLPRIGHINLAPGYRGGERQTEMLIRGLSAHGYQQKLVARRGEPLGLRCADVPGLQVCLVGASTVLAAWQLGRVDLVHAHQGRSVRAAWANKRIRGIPYLITRRQQKGPRATGFNRTLYASAAGIAVLSHAIGGSIGRLVPGCDYRIIPSALGELPFDSANARKLRQSWNADIVVGHIGALDDSHKGQMQIIDMARKYEQQSKRVAFVLVGSGLDEQKMRDASAGLGNIYFAGQVDNVGDYLAAFDVFLYPSRHEGLGSVLLDAMAFNLPIIATRVGGIPDIVSDEVNGFLVTPDSIDDMWAGLQRLIDDERLRRSIGERNGVKAQGYTPEKMTQRYMSFYSALSGQ
ncbi:MAG: glycosyltransferase family 4 protein [Gammaproteobacteria bacterium]